MEEYRFVQEHAFNVYIIVNISEKQIETTCRLKIEPEKALMSTVLHVMSTPVNEITCTVTGYISSTFDTCAAHDLNSQEAMILNLDYCSICEAFNVFYIICQNKTMTQSL